MMFYLNREVSGFTQVVAVDEKFDLFDRAWCVAELVEAFSSGIPQNVLIYSESVLDANYHRLKALDVRNCEASRAEDKVLILGKIENFSEFNSQLQALVFGSEGLFKNCLDG